MKQSRKEKEFVSNLMDWSYANLRPFPWRSVSDPFKILICEVFLQKTPANRIAERYDELMSAFLQERSSLDESALAKQFRGLGLSKRVKWVVDSLRLIESTLDGSLPSALEELMSLPGVGLYTACAVACFAYGKPHPLVDRNVARVLARVFGVNIPRPITQKSALYTLAASLVPKDCPKLYNYSIIDFAALVCRPKPRCGDCSQSRICLHRGSLRCSS